LKKKKNFFGGARKRGNHTKSSESASKRRTIPAWGEEEKKIRPEAVEKKCKKGCVKSEKRGRTSSQQTRKLQIRKEFRKTGGRKGRLAPEQGWRTKKKKKNFLSKGPSHYGFGDLADGKIRSTGSENEQKGGCPSGGSCWLLGEKLNAVRTSWKKKSQEKR